MLCGLIERRKDPVPGSFHTWGNDRLTVAPDVGILVAPQLTVVPAPPCNQASERMRGTPTLLGWCPTGWRYVIRQQFSDTPAMIRDARRHRRCRPALGVGQTGMGCTEIIDRPDQIHTML